MPVRLKGKHNRTGGNDGRASVSADLDARCEELDLRLSDHGLLRGHGDLETAEQSPDSGASPSSAQKSNLPAPQHGVTHAKNFEGLGHLFRLAAAAVSLALAAIVASSPPPNARDASDNVKIGYFFSPAD